MMKRLFLSVILSIAMILSLTACGSANNSATETKEAEPAISELAAPAPIELTSSNVEDYIAFRGEFTNSDYYSSLLYYISTSTIEFQAYGTAVGSFDNVEITVLAKIDGAKNGMAGEKWHLAGTDDEAVKFSFRMPTSGDYSSSYGITCNRNSMIMAGSCDFEVISVTGEFIPAN
jgi:hypothetical protein